MKKFLCKWRCIGLTLSFYQYSISSSNTFKEAIHIKSLLLEKSDNISINGSTSDKTQKIKEQYSKVPLYRKERKNRQTSVQRSLAESTRSSPATISSEKCRPFDGGKNSSAISFPYSVKTLPREALRGQN